MPRGYLSSRAGTAGDLHHLWNNNGTWWAHYTLHFDDRKRRIRRSLKTRSLEEAIRRRDELFARIAHEGEWVEERSDYPQHLRPLITVATWSLYSSAKGGKTWTLLPVGSCA